MSSNKKQLELGYAGLALLRNRLVGNEKLADDIIQEVSRIALPDNCSTDVNQYELSVGYEAWSETYDTIPNLLIEVEGPIVRKLIKDVKKGKALDTACGTGRYSKTLSDEGFEVTGIDSSKDMLEIAKIKAPQVKFILGDINSIPFEDKSFDLVICALALSHFSSLDRVIQELSRVLKKGGTLILSDIHPWFVIIGGQAEFQDVRGKKGYVYNYIHMPSEYIKAFARATLEIDECIEAKLNSKYLNPTDLNLEISKKTFNKALANLPVALIWKLHKK